VRRLAFAAAGAMSPGMAATGPMPPGTLSDDGVSDEDERALKQDRAERRARANEMIGMGAGIGAFGLASLATLGAVCPVCVVAAPALLGVGLYRRAKAAEPPDGDDRRPADR